MADEEDKAVKQAVREIVHLKDPNDAGKTNNGGGKWHKAYQNLDAVPKQYVQETLTNYKTLYSLKKVDATDPKAVKKRINDYLDFCVLNSVRPSVSSLALAMGVSSATILDWANKGEGYNPELKPMIQQTIQLMEAMWEDYMMNNKINPVSGVFLGKNRFGMRDEQNVVIKAKNSLDDLEDVDEIAEKYLAEKGEMEVIDNDEVKEDDNE